MCDWKKIAMFAGGALFGSAGIKLLTSSDAKKVYTQGTAAVLRMKDCAMQTVTGCRRIAAIFLLTPRISTKLALPQPSR